MLIRFRISCECETGARKNGERCSLFQTVLKGMNFFIAVPLLLHSNPMIWSAGMCKNNELRPEGDTELRPKRLVSRGLNG